MPPEKLEGLETTNTPINLEADRLLALEEDRDNLLGILQTSPNNFDSLEALNSISNLSGQVESFAQLHQGENLEANTSTLDSSFLDLEISSSLEDLRLALSEYKLNLLSGYLDHFQSESTVEYAVKNEYLLSLGYLRENSVLNDVDQAFLDEYQNTVQGLWIRPTLSNNPDELRAELRQILFYDLASFRLLDLSETFLAIHYAEGTMTPEELEAYRDIFQEIATTDREAFQENGAMAVLFTVSQSLGRHVPGQTDLLLLLNPEDPTGNCMSRSEFALLRLNQVLGNDYPYYVQIFGGNPGHIRLVSEIENQLYAIEQNQLIPLNEEDLAGTVTSEARSFFIRQYLGEISSTIYHGDRQERSRLLREQSQAPSDNDSELSNGVFGTLQISNLPTAQATGSNEEQSQAPESRFASYEEFAFYQSLSPEDREEFRWIESDLNQATTERERAIASLAKMDLYDRNGFDDLAFQTTTMILDTYNSEDVQLTFYDLYRIRGDYFRNHSQYEESLQAYELSRQSMPNDSPIERAIALVYLDQGDLASALTHAQTAININLEYHEYGYDWGANKLYGEILIQSARMQEAADSFRQGISLDLNHPASIRNPNYLALYNLLSEHPELGSSTELAQSYQSRYNADIRDSLN